MKCVPVTYDSNVLVGFDRSDDAGVYKLSDDIALVQTLDFFTPIVDDPFTFGQIAATNAMSDIYAMGGKPITAMNIVAFPLSKFTLDILSDVLRGGLDIVQKTGAQLLGGHSIDDPEFKYGLSVTGTVHPDKILKNHGLHDGDVIILTKPLGTGIIATAQKADMADKEAVTNSVKAMTALNDVASSLMMKYSVSACTDVTGFGLAGHLKEMLADYSLEIVIDSKELPVLPGIQDNAEMGLLPGGLFRNRDYIGALIKVEIGVEQYLEDVIFDPQTSGGLLIAVPEKEGTKLIKEMNDNNITDAKIIAKVKKNNNGIIRLV